MTSVNLAIPKECGVILLSGSALFPNSSMDLNIFEPRYKAMLEDSLEESWMFAVGNLISPEEDDLYECVSPVGTIALINSSKILADGRSSLVITGLYPVRFEEWEEDSLFPKAKISMIERMPPTPAQSEVIKELILDVLPKHLEHLPAGVRQSVLENFSSISDISALIDNITHNFIADSEFRHEMLCEMNDSFRASKIISALTNT